MKKHILILSLFVAVIGLSCKRDMALEGPSLRDQYGEFKVLQDFAASTGTVDFSKGEVVYFTAKFSRPAEWVLTIKGANNAEKTFSGKSAQLDISNSKWNGASSVFPSFPLGNCEAQLYIKDDSSYHKLNINITGKRNPGGTVIADFESGINPKWKIFAQNGAKMTFDIKDTGVVPQGNKYYTLGGTVNWDWLIGMIDFPATAMGANGFDLSGNPDDIYFNVVMSRPNNVTNGIMLFQFSEDDNGDKTFNPNNEDMYSVELKNLNASWKVYSIKYSELLALVNGSASTPKGNGRFDADKLFQVSCLFLANPSSGYSQVSFDYIAFTKGSPLEL
jgi:hypothetical protein